MGAEELCLEMKTNYYNILIFIQYGGNRSHTDVPQRVHCAYWDIITSALYLVTIFSRKWLLTDELRLLFLYNVCTVVVWSRFDRWVSSLTVRNTYCLTSWYCLEINSRERSLLWDNKGYQGIFKKINELSRSASGRQYGTYSVDVSAELHVSELLPGPVGVELRRPHEREVHAEAAVYGWAVQADEHPVRHRRPRRVLRAAVETYLRHTIQVSNHSKHKPMYSDQLKIRTLLAGMLRNRWKIASISLLLGPESAIFDVLSRPVRAQVVIQMPNQCCHLSIFFPQRFAKLP